MSKIRFTWMLVLVFFLAIAFHPALANEETPSYTYTYRSNQLGFSLTIPEECADDIYILEGDTYLELRHRASSSAMEADHDLDGGILFTVELFSPEDSSYLSLDNFQVLTVEERGAYVLYFPTDVQFADATMDAYYEVYDALVYATGYPDFITALQPGVFQVLSDDDISNDVKDHWARTSITRWSGYGIISGYADGTFRPNHMITRAEMATVMNNLMGYTATSGNSYTDVAENAWYYDAIQKASAAGVLSGYGNGRVGPNDNLTRQDAIVMLCKALYVSPIQVSNTGYSDDAAIADYAKGYIAALGEAGLIAYGGGSFRPTDEITRAEMITMIDTTIALYVVESGTYTTHCNGNVVVLADDVVFSSASITGNLIVSDSVTAPTRLQDTEVTGEVIGHAVIE